MALTILSLKKLLVFRYSFLKIRRSLPELVSDLQRDMMGVFF